MAGSYNHVTTSKGALRSPERALSMLDCYHGDVYEAIEEMFGMIWYLAEGNAVLVEEARQNYRAGLALSPGRNNRGKQ